jgi:hypothetical protein
MYAVFFLSGDSPASEFYVSTFQNTLSVQLHRSSEEEEKERIQHSQCGKSLQSRRYILQLVLHGEWSVISTTTDTQCSCLFETYLHDHSHRCAPPFRMVGVFSVQGWWHRSYCGEGRCHTWTHIHHEADSLLSLPGVSTLTVETRQTVSNKTQATKDKCWTVCISEYTVNTLGTGHLNC